MERKLIKFITVVASSLLLSFSSFADEVKTDLVPIDDVTASQILDLSDHLVMSAPLRAPSINPDVPFKVLGVEALVDSDQTHPVAFNVIWQGSFPETYDRFRVVFNGVVTNAAPSRGYQTTFSYDYADGPLTISLYDYANNSIGPDIYSTSISVTADGGSAGSVDVGINTYLSFVGQVFSWILATLGILIAFLLSNPFLAVSLFLFITGSVISFYIRIKNS